MKHPHYFKPVAGLQHIDVYRTLLVFGVTDPCLQHAIKKLLVAGGRGAKDISQDVQEAIDTLLRWQEMRQEDKRSCRVSDAFARLAGYPAAEAGVDVRFDQSGRQEAVEQNGNTGEHYGSAAVLPDGSAFSVASFSLPEDHWLYAPRVYAEGATEPLELPAPILNHAQHRETVTAAARYAVRGATMCGQEPDFDPDALVLNMVYALCGPSGGAASIVEPERPRHLCQTCAQGHPTHECTAGHGPIPLDELAIQQGGKEDPQLKSIVDEFERVIEFKPKEAKEPELPPTDHLVDPTGKPQWKDAPHWACYLTQDENGVWKWWHKKPAVMGSRWQGVGMYAEVNSGDVVGRWQDNFECAPGLTVGAEA